MDERQHRQMDHRDMPTANARYNGTMSASDKRALDKLVADYDDLVDAMADLFAQVDEIQKTLIAADLLKIAPKEG